MTDAAENPAKGANAPAGERRQVTVLFADMAGFTAISERLGEEGTYTLIQPIYELMAGAVKEQGGSVREFTGDGIMALFGVPDALEDAPLRACRAALAIQKRLAAASPTIKARLGVHPQMRVGINTGLAVVTQIRGEGANMTALGDTVNLASRLQTLAEPGKVLLSEATYRQVQGLVDTTFAGEHEIKGKLERQKAYLLYTVREGAVRFDAAVSRGLTAFVGRSEELESLERQLATSRTKLQVVDVLAEPGMGKSRLLHEFRQKIDKDHVFILQGNCAPDGKQTPFLPFIEILRGSFRIRVGESEKDVADKLVTGLTALGLCTPQSLALLLNLLGLKPPEGSLSGLDGVLIGLRTRDLFQSLLVARCAMSPVTMIVEDLHWIDSVSEEVLGKIVGGLEGLPLLVVVTRRPEYVPAWLDRPEVMRLTLAPLAASAVGQLVSARLGDAQLPPELAKLIADRAEGNALFAEEIVSFLSERGFLRTNANRLEYDEAAVASAMPASVQGLLTSRVDRLSQDDRALLQAASVIGRRFSPELLATVAPAASDAQTRLDAMSALDLVYPDGRSGDYAFKHALVRDALYQSLLTAPRTALHLKIADEIERHSGNRLVEVAEALAHHYSQTDRDEKAFTYFAMAGSKSLGVYSLDQAAVHFNSALALLDNRPKCASKEQTAEFLADYTLYLNICQNLSSLIGVMERHLSGIEDLHDDPRLVLIKHQYSYALMWNLRFGDAEKIQKQVQAVADRLGDARSKAYSLAGEIHLSSVLGPKTLGEFERLKGEAIATASRTSDAYIQNWTMFVIGWEEFHRGRMVAAHNSATALLSGGKQLKDPRSIGLGLALFSWIALVSDSYEAALKYSEQALEEAITPWDRDAAINGMGNALILLQRVSEGSKLVHEYRQRCLAVGCLYPLVASDGILGVGKVLEGNISSGIRMIEKALIEREREGYRTVADWYRMFLCDIYVEILSGKDKPSLLVLLKNLAVLLKVLIRGHNRVISLVATIRQNPHFDPDGHHIGHCELILGLLSKARKNREKALEHLSEARRIEMQFGPTPMLARIENALAELQT